MICLTLRGGIDTVFIAPEHITSVTEGYVEEDASTGSHVYIVSCVEPAYAVDETPVEIATLKRAWELHSGVLWANDARGADEHPIAFRLVFNTIDAIFAPA